MKLRRLMSLALGGPVTGLAIAISVIGCGDPGAPQQAKSLIENAAHELKPAQSVDLTIQSSDDTRVVAEVEREDGSTETWTTVKDAGDWVLDACEATDNAGLTVDCVQLVPQTPSPFLDCIRQIDTPELWNLCSPLADPNPEKQAAAEESWLACMNSTEPEFLRTASRCALLLPD